ncbi:hypothetical protein HanRHA438_Chr17g0803971 [Helianthus annuus]|nr:hypothetical protein HanIR_Chr17g0861211 [Helianthus annuus]KAJ0825506.1 hypothetical protein HanRHA438_Chr17g0803971 [Helianthus annuus]
MIVIIDSFLLFKHRQTHPHIDTTTSISSARLPFFFCSYSLNHHPITTPFGPSACFTGAPSISLDIGVVETPGDFGTKIISLILG